MTSEARMSYTPYDAWVLRAFQPGDTVSVHTRLPELQNATLALVAIEGEQAEVIASHYAESAREFEISAPYDSARRESSRLADTLSQLAPKQKSPGLYVVLALGHPSDVQLREIGLLRRQDAHPGKLPPGSSLTIDGALFVLPRNELEGLQGDTWPATFEGPDPYYNHSQCPSGSTTSPSTAMVAVVARDVENLPLDKVPWCPVSIRRGRQAIVAVPQENGLPIGNYVFSTVPLGALMEETGPIVVNYEYDGLLYYDVLEPSAPASLMKCTLYRWNPAARDTTPDGEASLRIDWIDGRPKLSLFDTRR